MFSKNTQYNYGKKTIEFNRNIESEDEIFEIESLIKQYISLLDENVYKYDSRYSQISEKLKSYGMKSFTDYIEPKMFSIKQDTEYQIENVNVCFDRDITDDETLNKIRGYIRMFDFGANYIDDLQQQKKSKEKNLNSVRLLSELGMKCLVKI